jgi:hypothetical protein
LLIEQLSHRAPVTWGAAAHPPALTVAAVRPERVTDFVIGRRPDFTTAETGPRLSVVAFKVLCAAKVTL